MLDYSPKCGRKLKPTAIPFRLISIYFCDFCIKLNNLKYELMLFCCLLSDGDQSSPIKPPAGLFSVTNTADESNRYLYVK